MLPAYGSPSPARMRMVVVLPAPFRPTSPMRSPGSTRSAGPSADSSVRAPARTSRSVAVITLLSSSLSLLVGARRLLAPALVGARRLLAPALVGARRLLAPALVGARRLLAPALVGEDRGPL